MNGGQADPAMMPQGAMPYNPADDPAMMNPNMSPNMTPDINNQGYIAPNSGNPDSMSPESTPSTMINPPVENSGYNSPNQNTAITPDMPTSTMTPVNDTPSLPQNNNQNNHLM